jgi:hypothetical protein
MKATLARLLFVVVPLFGCATDPDDSSDDSLDVASTCPTNPTKIDHSLAVTDPAVLAHFPFTKTMQHVLASVTAPGETTKQLYQSWMATFGPTDCTNPKIDPNHYGEVCPRNPEFKLASTDPTNPASKVQFLPVGVFNRFDLAPKNGANCGEYRIVYALHSTDPTINGRGFYIFEATLPNPAPDNKLAGCLPIAEFWQSLSKMTSFTQIGNQLDKLYYQGTAIPGVGPVVQAQNYGLAVNNDNHGTGQIRSNMFIDFTQWHLREFKTTYTCPAGSTQCALSIDHVTVKTNPANELFDGTSSKATAFLQAWKPQVKSLLSMDVSTIGMTIANQYNEFESVSQLPDNDVLYDQHADGAMIDVTEGQLLLLGSTLTPTDVFRRATTQTCGGCHQQSSGIEAQLGGTNPDGSPFTWPASLGFVQINESRQLSPALTQFFLPHRQGVLDQFIAKNCNGAATDADDGLTIGGSPVGAAN